MKNIAIFASGDGSNAEAIVKYFHDNPSICVKLVMSNRRNAGVHNRMANYNIPTFTFSKEEWETPSEIINILHQNSINLIVLAGFLCVIKPDIIKAFDGRIINIHPSLLPKFGGAGMWGNHVHEAVIAAGEKESGITIHYVTEEIDGGKIIFQTSCDVKPNDTAETLAKHIHLLEHRHFPQVIAQLLESI